MSIEYFFVWEKDYTFLHLLTVTLFSSIGKYCVLYTFNMKAFLQIALVKCSIQKYVFDYEKLSDFKLLLTLQRDNDLLCIECLYVYIDWKISCGKWAVSSD